MKNENFNSFQSELSGPKERLSKTALLFTKSSLTLDIYWMRYIHANPASIFLCHFCTKKNQK